MELKKLKKLKADKLVAARVPTKTLELLKRYNINISLAVREHLLFLANELSKKKSA